MSRKKKKPKRKQTRSGKGPVYMPMPRLFREDLTDEQRRDAIAELARSFTEERDTAFATIERFVSQFDPFHALSVLSAYGLSIDLTKDGISAGNSQDKKVNQDHVELLQALILQNDAENLPRKTPRPPDIQELWDALIDLGRGFDLSRLRPLDSDNDADAITLLQEKIRGNTRAIRNWGYYHQVKDIGSRLLAPLDDKLQLTLGFSGTELTTVLDSLVRGNEARINVHRKKFFGAINKPNLREMVAAYAEAMPTADCSRLLDHFTEHKFTLQQVKAFLLAHSDFALVDCFTHEAFEVADRSGVAPERVKAIFQALGMAPGDLKGRDPKKFVLDNPVWTSPWILLSEDSIFACIPQTALSFLFEVVGRLTASHEQLKNAWHDRRAGFLEEDIATSLSKALPGASIYRNVEWKVPDKNQNGETDLLVVLDSIAIIVEAKSGAVSEQSKRGAPDRLRSEIRTLLESPALQSQRLLTAIEANRSGQSGLILSQDIDLSTAKYIMRLSVTLEDFSTIQSNIGKLQKLGLISKEIVPAPTICLADLHSIIEILDMPAMFLHYLHRRMQLEGRFSHDADELDLLGLYLMNGLLFGAKETDGTHITLYRMSEKVDCYMMSLSEGITTPKPRRNLSDLWTSILDRVIQVQYPRWAEIVIALLDIDDHGQKLLRREIRTLVKKHRYQKTTPFLNTLVYIPDGVGRTAVAVVVLPHANIAHRRDAAQAAAVRAFRDTRPTRCLVLVYDADGPTFPYNFLILADRL